MNTDLRVELGTVVAHMHRPHALILQETLNNK